MAETRETKPQLLATELMLSTEQLDQIVEKLLAILYTATTSDASNWDKTVDNVTTRPVIQLTWAYNAAAFKIIGDQLAMDQEVVNAIVGLLSEGLSFQAIASHIERWPSDPQNHPELLRLKGVLNDLDQDAQSQPLPTTFLTSLMDDDPLQPHHGGSPPQRKTHDLEKAQREFVASSTKKLLGPDVLHRLLFTVYADEHQPDPTPGKEKPAIGSAESDFSRAIQISRTLLLLIEWMMNKQPTVSPLHPVAFTAGDGRVYEVVRILINDSKNQHSTETRWGLIVESAPLDGFERFVALTAQLCRHTAKTFATAGHNPVAFEYLLREPAASPPSDNLGNILTTLLLILHELRNQNPETNFVHPAHVKRGLTPHDSTGTLQLPPQSGSAAATPNESAERRL